MIDKRVAMLLAPEKNKRLLIIDKCGFTDCCDYSTLLTENGYEVYEYVNVEEFRALYEERLKVSQTKIAVIVLSDIYVPYDIARTFRKVSLSISDIFQKLNAVIVKEHLRDLDLISFAYDRCYEDCTAAHQTEQFLRDTVFAEPTVRQYCQSRASVLSEACSAAGKYTDWIDIAKQAASIKYYAVRYGFPVDLSFVDDGFARFVQYGYGMLSTHISKEYPVLVTRTLGVISGGKTEKSAIIVVDGMSLFDFEVISRYFDGIEYDYHCSYAIIPTTTPISRQSLLSGKFPRELSKPFSLVNEEKEFVTGAKQLGYTDKQIQYARGFEPDISPLTKILAIIVNEVDDIVHGQRQDRTGMFNDVNVLAKSGKLQRLIIRLARLGFTVYITADHGNTPCVGAGGFRGGIEIESRSMRMAVLKDFAEVSATLSQHTTKYPGYYLDKSYSYYVCEPGVSYDTKGESVVTHGGASIDEVIVPFIKVAGVKQLD